VVRAAVLALLLSLTLAVGGCSSAPAATVATSSTPTLDSQLPSPQALVACGAEAREDIGNAIGVEATGAATHTWAGGLYSCPLHFPGATMGISVQDFTDPAAAGSFLADLRSRTAHPTDLPGIGDAAFAGPDGSLYVAKDADVLHVDVSGLPATFGTPPHTRANTAFTVAVTILACWSEQ
jgi:hypothetical protein